MTTSNAPMGPQALIVDLNSFYNQHPDDLALQYGDYSDLDANEQAGFGAFGEFARGTGFAAPPIGNHPSGHLLPSTDEHERRLSPNSKHLPDSIFCPGNVSGPVSGAGFTNQAPFAAPSGPPHPGPGFGPYQQTWGANASTVPDSHHQGAQTPVPRQPSYSPLTPSPLKHEWKGDT